MVWHPAQQSLPLLRITVAGLTVLCGGIWLIPTVWINPWFVLGYPAVVAVGVAVAVWYLPRYLATCTISCFGKRLCIRRGLWWQKEQHIPLSALRTFAWWDGPLSRRFGYRTLWLRYAGGFAFFPPLTAEAADRLHQMLTEGTV